MVQYAQLAYKTMASPTFFGVSLATENNFVETMDDAVNFNLKPWIIKQISRVGKGERPTQVECCSAQDHLDPMRELAQQQTEGLIDT